MTRLLPALALMLTTATLAFAQDDFSRRLTPEERKAAGLDRLSPTQIAALDALVQRDRQGLPAPVPAQAAPVPPPAAAPVTRAAPPPAETKPEQKKSSFGLPAKDEVDTITGTLVGEYRGWNGYTIFRLEDGQTWVQTDHLDRHEATLRQNPRVKITKAAFGDYKLTVEGNPMWVRVRRVQ